MAVCFASLKLKLNTPLTGKYNTNVMILSNILKIKVHNNNEKTGAPSEKYKM